MNANDPGLPRLCGFWLLTALLAGCFLLRARPAATPEPRESSKAADERLPNLVWINTDPWTSLVRLPRIGETRAKDIVSFRKRQTSADRPVAFRQIEDLDPVPGVGPATCDDIEPYISFETGAATPERP